VKKGLNLLGLAKRDYENHPKGGGVVAEDGQKGAVPGWEPNVKHLVCEDETAGFGCLWGGEP